MRTLTALSLLPLLIAAAAAQQDSRSSGTDWKAWLESHTSGFSGVVVIGRDDEIEFEAAYGLADASTGRSNTPATRFNLGSINKTFTAVAIARLIQEGRLSLDDTVSKLLPDYPNRAAASRITIRDLITHRSGVAQFMRADFGEASVAEMAQMVGAAPQAFEPGARQAYSNGGYVVLGRIIEVASGRSYDDYVADHVYRPAGMTSTGFFGRGDSDDRIAVPVASGAQPEGPRRGNPAGGSYATAADLFRFVRALRAGTLLDRRMTEYVVSGTFSEAQPWGFAMRQQTVGSARFIGNGGGAPGVNAEFRFHAKGPETVVVLANDGPPAATNLMTLILGRIAGRK